MKDIMQIIKIVFLSLLFTSVLSAELLTPTLEIYIKVINSYTPTGTTNFVLSSQSTVWDGPTVESTSYENLITWIADFPGGFSVANNNGSGIAGFNNSVSAIYNGYPIFGYGLYKLYVDSNPDGYITLDYRDDQYGHYSSLGSPSGQGQDIWIEYDENTAHFWIPSDGDNFSECSPHDACTIWDLNNMLRSTEKFQPFPPEQITGTVDIQDHPIIQWIYYHPDAYHTGFNIFRGTPIPGEEAFDFELIATAGQNIREFTDLNHTYTSSTPLRYRIVTINCEAPSEPATLIFTPPPTNPTALTVIKVDNHPKLT